MLKFSGNLQLILLCFSMATANISDKTVKIVKNMVESMTSRSARNVIDRRLGRTKNETLVKS